jgi:iron complex outermembrane receptor protein/hemoglobin/transferrin/lactoferrin receptor protein
LPLASGPVYDQSVQRFTGYDQLGGDVKSTIPAGPGELTVAAMTFRQYDAPRTDKCTADDCRFFDQQVLDLGYARWAAARVGPLRDLEAGVAVSRTLEERSRIRTSRLPELERDRVLTLQYYARASPVSQPLGEGAALQISAGTDGFVDLLASEARTGEGPVATPALRGKYLDGSRYGSAAVFGFGELVVGPALAFTAGARLSYSRAQVAADPEGLTPAFADDHAVPVAGGGVRVVLADGVWLVGNLDQGYRAPNLDDLTASSSEGPGYQLPNPSLVPERSLSLEGGAVVRHPRFAGALFGYQTYIDDVITRTPSTCPVDMANRCDDAPNVFQLTNADAGTVHGVELDVRVRLPSGVSVFGVATYTHASTIDDTGALAPDSKIPPLSGRLGVRFDLASSRYFVETIADFARPQDRLSAVDEGDPRIPPGGTPGYGLVHLRGGARLGDGLYATLTVHNLTDSGYRVHGSGVDGPGFGALFSVSAAARVP